MSRYCQVRQLQSAITTWLYYFPGLIVANSLVLEDVIRALETSTGCPVIFRTILKCNSTAVVLDVYGDIDPTQLAEAGGSSFRAVSIIDALVPVEPDEEQLIHLHPKWTHVAAGVTPPLELSIPDTSEDVRVTRNRPIVLCGVMTRVKRECKNPTKHLSGLCWRHRLGCEK